ncbi:MAG: hypothetical protein AB7G06_06160 [Bdellovibrionales bacterium]
MLHHDFDVYQQRFYLTPTGWSETQPATETQIIEVWELDIYQPAGWSREYHDWTCMWASNKPEWTLTIRDDLRARHPFPDFCKPDIRSVINVGFPLAASMDENKYLIA